MSFFLYFYYPGIFLTSKSKQSTDIDLNVLIQSRFGLTRTQNMHNPTFSSYFCLSHPLFCSEKTSLCSGKTLLCSEKTLLCSEKILLCSEKTLLCSEKTLLCSEKTTLCSIKKNMYEKYVRKICTKKGVFPYKICGSEM